MNNDLRERSFASGEFSFLHDMIREFQAPISFAMGYGSGVFKQSGSISEVNVRIPLV